MPSVPYRSPKQVFSDSEDENVRKAESLDNQEGYDKGPRPSYPRINFSNGVPLTPRRTVAFAPTPLKKLNFSTTKIKGTPGKNIPGMKFVKSPAPDTSPFGNLDDEDDDDGNVGSVVMDFRSLKVDTGTVTGRTFEDEIVENMDEIDDVLDSPSMSRSLTTSTLHIGPPPVLKFSSFSSPSTTTQMPFSSNISSPSPSESDSESEWLPTQTPKRRPGKARRLIASDSEDDEELLAAPEVQAKPQKPKQVIDLIFSEDEEIVPVAEEENGGYYGPDDSYGSLRDFIIDDSECENYVEAPSTEEEESEVEVWEPINTTKGIKAVEMEKVDAPSQEEGQGERDWDSDSDAGILRYSPPRRPLQLPPLETPMLAVNCDSEPEQDESISKKVTEKSKTPKLKGDPSKKEWALQRVRVANEIFGDLDRRVFESKLGERGAKARLDWNNRLLTTAGMARSKRSTRDNGSSKEYWIELSEKVLTSEGRILNTVAHEMCHLATWIISGDFKNPHGHIFKSWGRKVMHARKDIEVTTKHSYVIEYKYEWKCSNERCGQVYKRQSKSIDTSKHACGSCRSKLIPLFETKQKAASGFQLYLKENMKNAKAAMPGASHGDVMRALSKRWTEAGEVTKGEHEIYWKGMASKKSTNH
ncbi:hypothetical protein I305_01631 [Cryptococcus gattii E566]|uniref:HMG box domain-containing protein n=1 Tax=Cryptococcus gattii serotype B (strain WM276 / ATCC MYA-4071) TaxID=367775 RepID=E6RA10_CRYGW|nr:Hypothetical Protein CGB_G6140W [Cryptococcus gattii WM276]ADV23648.1 Hypothetical Protein CGB_G6140W [Cryptococcus gattii WM276]KIY36055.1 hypothetical protein I305_01631 [Cryptococcus gattii E566]KJE05553.1 hypothetical protein I311_00759 [Cryptococcus gattii NT-10]